MGFTPRLCFNGGRFKYIRLCALKEAVWPSWPPIPLPPNQWHVPSLPHTPSPLKLLSSGPILRKCVRAFKVDAWETPCIWYREVFTPNYFLWLLSTE